MTASSFHIAWPFNVSWCQMLIFKLNLPINESYKVIEIGDVLYWTTWNYNILYLLQIHWIKLTDKCLSDVNVILTNTGTCDRYFIQSAPSINYWHLGNSDITSHHFISYNAKVNEECHELTFAIEQRMIQYTSISKAVSIPCQLLSNFFFIIPCLVLHFFF